jgi:hypothetical protein
MQDKIDNLLENQTPRQTSEQREAMFLRVMEAVSNNPASAVVSPYGGAWFMNVHYQLAFGVFLFLLLGAGSTAALASSARPGDLLFPIEQATEQIRLRLATDEYRQVLEQQFLDERFHEVDEILSEESSDTNTTDRTISEVGEKRVADAVAVLLAQAQGRNDERTNERLRSLLTTMESVRVSGRPIAEPARIQSSENRVEIRTETERIRVEDKDGEVRIKYRSYDDTDDWSDDGSDTWHDDDTDDESRSRRSGGDGDDDDKDDNKRGSEYIDNDIRRIDSEDNRGDGDDDDRDDDSRSRRSGGDGDDDDKDDDGEGDKDNDDGDDDKRDEEDDR